MRRLLEFALTSLMFCTSLKSLAKEQLCLPGRIENTSLFRAHFGECDVFFYMTPQKHQFTQEIIQRLNKDILITVGQCALPCPTHEILVDFNKSPDQKVIIDDFSKKIVDSLKESFEINIEGISAYVNLNLNWEAVKLHQDRFYKQYKYFQETSLSPGDYNIIQDLTLVDWEMTKGTVGGTMVQDGRLGDRFIITIFPNEIVGTLYTEPAIFAKGNIEVTYPGHMTMPHHSAIVPMDYYGGLFPGSAKGKKISTVVRGVVPKPEINAMRNKASELVVNRKQLEIFEGKPGWKYVNGITLKTLPEKVPTLNCEWVYKYKDQENIEILKVPCEKNRLLIEILADLFHIRSNSFDNVNILTLTKRDGGFSNFKAMHLEIVDGSRILLLNRSVIPQNYRYFNLAEDYTNRGLPWIQLYHFDSSMAMEIPYSVFKQLSLTPLEELLYRNEYTDEAEEEQDSRLIKKLATHIDLFIFPPEFNQSHID